MPPHWLLPLIAAPFLGSFAALLIRRLPAGEPVALARSRCDACGQVLEPWDLVPLVSFAALGGRCRRCRARIPPMHPAVEIACLAVAACAAWVEADPARLWLGCALGWTLLALAWIDWRHMLLPDALTLPLVPAGLAAAWLLGAGEAVGDHAAAAAFGYLAFRGIEIGYRRLRGRDGLGRGDAKLMAAAGAWLGLAPLPTVVLVAALSGLAIAGALRLRGLDVAAGTALPFGPALCLAIWTVWLGFDPLGGLADAAGCCR